MRLVPNSPVSLYIQLKEILIERINDGTYPAGSFAEKRAVLNLTALIMVIHHWNFPLWTFRDIRQYLRLQMAQ